MIYMVDGALNPRIQVFDTDGNFVTSIGTKWNGDGELSKPEHVNIDSSGNVFVVDRGNQRIKYLLLVSKFINFTEPGPYWQEPLLS